MKKFIIPSICIACLLLSCSKDGTVPTNPTTNSPGSGDMTFEAVFYDELTHQPIPSLNVRFTEQWGANTLPNYFWQKTDAAGRVRRLVRSDRNLLVSVGVDSGAASYYLNLGELQIVPSQLIPGPGFQGYWIPEGLLTFQPMYKRRTDIEFQVDLPRKADLNIEYVQDSAYSTTFSQGDVIFYFWVYATDSSGKSMQMIEDFQTFVGDGTPNIQAHKSFHTYGARPHKIVWGVFDSERVTSYNDDGQIRDLRRGEIQVPPLSHQQPTTVTIHF